MAPRLAPVSCLLPLASCRSKLSNSRERKQPATQPPRVCRNFLFNYSLVEPVWRTRSQGSYVRRLTPSFMEPGRVFTVAGGPSRRDASPLCHSTSDDSMPSSLLRRGGCLQPAPGQDAYQHLSPNAWVSGGGGQEEAERSCNLRRPTTLSSSSLRIQNVAAISPINTLGKMSKRISCTQLKIYMQYTDLGNTVGCTAKATRVVRASAAGGARGRCGSES